MVQVFNKYESISAFLRDINTAKTSKIFSGSEDSKYQGDVTWYGTASYEEAMDLIIKGDDVNLKNIAVNGKIRTPKRTNVGRSIPTTNVFGFMPHIPNFVAGLPNNMMWQTTMQHPEKIVTIVCAIGTPTDWSARKVIEVNSKIVSAVKMLEASGTRVNLYLYNGAYKADEECALIIKLKDSGRLMQLAKMAYCLVNPSMHRRHCFRYRETRHELKNKWWKGGYGRTQSKSMVEATLKRNGIKYDYLCTTLSLENESAENIQRLLQEK